MSEQIIPEENLQEVSADVQEQQQDTTQSLTDKTLAELSEIFVKLKESADAMSRSKEAENIKAAFFKLLGKLKGETPEGTAADSDPFEQVEENFKALYADYKKERAEFNRAQDAQREANLKVKEQIIEDLKSLVESGDELSVSFPALRELQNRWREAGPVPVTAYRNINDTYQFYVEKFYDIVKIDRDLRDLDFRKNLEAKEAFCAAAEKLAENESIVDAFHELQKLHEQWKEFGPVVKEKRDEIWNRFKAATAVINKKYQAYFEDQKDKMAANLAEKTLLCERLEQIAESEVKSSSEWNALSKEIEEIQAKWKTIGFATKKENQKIYDRFRAACDKFFERKRNYYTEVKDNLEANLEKKLELIREAEELKLSTEWKKATDQFISLQKRWKEIGAVPRKKSEQVWKRFRAACDEFFENRDKSGNSGNELFANLKAKKALIQEIIAFEKSDNESANSDAMREFDRRWQEIGHVPFKEKDNVAKAFKDAMIEKFPLFREARQGRGNGRPARSPKDLLIEKYRTLQQDIATYENNIGFFSMSKNSEALVNQMRERIEAAKAELAELEARIRKDEEGEE